MEIKERIAECHNRIEELKDIKSIPERLKISETIMADLKQIEKEIDETLNRFKQKEAWKKGELF